MGQVLRMNTGKPEVGKPETRATLYVTYAYDDVESAPVVDVSGSLNASRRCAPTGVTYLHKRLRSGIYEVGDLIEFREEGLVLRAEGLS